MPGILTHIIDGNVKSRVCANCLRFHSIEVEAHEAKKFLHKGGSKRKREQVLKHSQSLTKCKCNSAWYCTRQCSEEHWRRGHWLQCAHGSPALAALKEIDQSGEIDVTLALVACWLGIIYQALGESSKDDEAELLRLFTDSKPDEGGEGEEDVFGVIRGIILHSKVSDLKNLAIKEVDSVNIAKVFTFERWATALNFVRRFSAKVQMISPLHSYVRSLFSVSSNSRDEALKQLGQILSNNSGSASKRKRGADEAARHQAFVVLDSDLEGRDLSARTCINLINRREVLSRTSISVLVLDYTARDIPHRCISRSEYVPRSEFMSGDGRGDDSDMVTIESITNSTQSSSINWLGWVADSHEERHAALRARFGAELFQECICSLCCYQKYKGDVKKVSHESANEAGYFYMSRGNFAKAEGLFRRVVEHAVTREKKGRGTVEEFLLGESYHALGACLLSQGKWQEAHKVWCDGSARALSHERLRETMRKLATLDVGSETKTEATSSDNSAQPVCEEIFAEEVGYSDAVSGNQHLRRKIFLLGGEGLVSEGMCDWVVQRAEEHARNHGGWTRQRHYGAPTTDLPISALADVLQWFKESFFAALRPSLQQQYYHLSDMENAEFAIHDVFIVKYDANTADGQKFLPEHTDESTHSLIIALNDARDYTGGGTHFPILQATIKPQKGQVLCFTGGSLRHSGEPVLEGVRYIIAAFLLLGKKESPGGKYGTEAERAFSFGF